LQDGDDEMVEDLRPTGNQVKMPVRHRIEAAGVDGFYSIHASRILSGTGRMDSPAFITKRVKKAHYLIRQ